MTIEESFLNFWDTFPTSESSNSASPINSYPAPSPAPMAALIPLSDQEIPTVVPESSPVQSLKKQN